MGGDKAPGDKKPARPRKPRAKRAAAPKPPASRTAGRSRAARKTDAAQAELPGLEAPAVSKPAARRKARARKTATPASATEQVGVDALLYVPGRVAPAIVQILTVALLTYYFSPEEIGRYDLTFRFILFLGACTFVWLNMAILRFYAAYEAREERVFAPVMGLLKYIAVLAGVACAAGLYFSGRGVRFGIYNDLLLPGIAVFAAYSFYETGLAVLRAKRRPLTYSVATTLNAVLRLPLAVAFFLWLSMGIEGMLWSIAIMYFIAYIITIQWHVGWPGLPKTKERQKLLWEVLAYGLPIWLTQVLNFFLTNLDRWLINAFAATPDNAMAGVGLFAVATNLVDQPMLLVFQTFTLAVFPSVVMVWEKPGKEAAETMVSELTRTYFILCLPLVVFFTVLARPIFEVLAHGEARYAYSASAWLATASFFYGLSYFASFGLHLAKRTPLLLTVTICALAVNVVVNMVLVPMEGYVGAAQARLISNFVLTTALAVAGFSSLRWRLPMWAFLRIFVASWVAGGCAWLLSLLLPYHWGCLLALTALGGSVYLVVLLWLREISLAEIGGLLHGGMERLKKKPRARP